MHWDVITTGFWHGRAGIVWRMASLLSYRLHSISISCPVWRYTPAAMCVLMSQRDKLWHSLQDTPLFMIWFYINNKNNVAHPCPGHWGANLAKMFCWATRASLLPSAVRSRANPTSQPAAWNAPAPSIACWTARFAPDIVPPAPSPSPAQETKTPREEIEQGTETNEESEWSRESDRKIGKKREW